MRNCKGSKFSSNIRSSTGPFFTNSKKESKGIRLALPICTQLSRSCTVFENNFLLKFLFKKPGQPLCALLGIAFFFLFFFEKTIKK